MTNKSTALTKSDLLQANIRSWIYQPYAFNYETMQSPGFVLSMSSCLRKLYGDDPELLAEKNDKYFQFYNTNPLINPAITGIILSMEESKVDGITDTCLALRTGLMGSMAGLGDSLFWITGRTVFCSIAGYMACEGSPVGLSVSIIMYILVAILRYFMFNIGYTQGSKFLTERTSQLRNLTHSAVIIGLCVIGAMIPSNVVLNTKLTFTMGDATASFDEFLNSILPYLLSLGITAGVYFGLKTKVMTTIRMIWTIIILCLLLSLIGIV